MIGPNGAGKTTLLAALMGLLPRARHGRYSGEDLRRLEVEERVRAGICLVPERRELFAEMTVADNLDPRRLHALGDRRRSSRPRGHVPRFPRLSERRSSSPARSPAASGRCWRSAAR